jgi:hypothetical protein
MFKRYLKQQISELRPYILGEDMSKINIGDIHKLAGSPRTGDMIARDPRNPQDQWLVPEQFFKENFEELNED